VQPGAWESDDTIRVFGEKANQVLSADLTVGGVTIPAGTRVNSYYVHADAIGDANTDHPFSGSVSFGTKVLAVATSTADLQKTSPVLRRATSGMSSTACSRDYDPKQVRAWAEAQGIEMSARGRVPPTSSHASRKANP
jgi:hypothetical protein